MRHVQSICVYCGSGKGNNPAYAEAAALLGRVAAAAGIRIVYGGGSVGLMGIVARSATDAGGKVTGIIPEFLVKREGIISDLDELIVTDNMHTRKRTMFERSDGFVVLPGGLGTLEETSEIMTWFQLGQHHKPIVLANIENFWDPLIALLEHMTEDAFIRPGLEVAYGVSPTIEKIFPKLETMAATFRTAEIEKSHAAADTEGEAPSLSNL